MINHPWITCGAGIFFCISGIYFFFRNIFEENRSTRWAVFIMIMGVALITIGSYQLIILRK